METSKDKLKKMTSWNVEPLLTDSEIDELLAAASLEDPAGLAPLHEEWTPTYDLNAAAASAWLIKAGRTSSTTELAPESPFVTSKIFDNCLRMSRLYRARMSTSVSTSPFQA